MLYKLIYKIGQRLRNPSLNEIYNNLKASEKFTLKELEGYQSKKTLELVKFANENSPFYQDLWRKNHVDINNIKSLKDFSQLPIITKRDLLKNRDQITISQNIFKKTFKVTTSGSTGESLEFYREEFSDSFNRASVLRGYSWFGIQVWNRNGYFWGFNFSNFNRIKSQFLDKLQNRFRLFSYKTDDLQKFLKKLKKAKYLHGYSSMIYQIAKMINQEKIEKPLNLKMIKGTSEKIYQHYQEEVSKAFGLKIISEYGAAETGIIAFECPHGKMHLNMEGVLVEEIDNEIIVTNLQLKNFPIIRYKLGDYIKLAQKETECKCGMKHLILEEVTGRIGNTIYGKKNVYPSLYLYYIFKNLSSKNNILINHQVLQNIKGELIFRISEKLHGKELKLLNQEIRKYFSDDIKFTILESQNIFSDKKEKLKNFISSIDE